MPHYIIFNVYVKQYVLAEQEMTLKAKNDAADTLIQIVSTENEIVQKEKQIGNNWVWQWLGISLSIELPSQQQQQQKKKEKDWIPVKDIMMSVNYKNVRRELNCISYRYLSLPLFVFLRFSLFFCRLFVVDFQRPRRRKKCVPSKRTLRWKRKSVKLTYEKLNHLYWQPTKHSTHWIKPIWPNWSRLEHRRKRWFMFVLLYSYYSPEEASYPRIAAGEHAKCV